MTSETSQLHYWNLSPSFSVVQAVLLFCGAEPSDLELDVERSPRTRPVGYVPVRNAILNALEAGILRGEIRHVYYEDGPSSEVCVHSTKITRQELDKFFRDRDVPGHFFGSSDAVVPNTGPLGPMPAKLRAAIAAWEAFAANPAMVGRHSPKQALTDWLTERASELGLVNRDGRPNTSGIEEVAKVANWKPTGGATPTPEPQPRVDFIPGISDPVEPEEFDLDDTSPF